MESNQKTSKMALTIEEIILKIQTGLKECSEKNNISRTDIQINIRKGNDLMGNIVLILMKANDAVKDENGKDVKVKTGELFKLNGAESLFVSGYLKKALATLATKNNIDIKSVNARIFTKEESFYPSIYLQDGLKIVKEITVNELISI